MDTEIKTYLADIKQSAERIIEVTLDKSFEQFEGDWVTRGAPCPRQTNQPPISKNIIRNAAV